MEANNLLIHKITSRDYEVEINSNTMDRPQIVHILESDDYGLKSANHLKYFKMPKPSLYPLDLNSGFENYQFRQADFFNLNLSKIEEYIMSNKDRFLHENIEDRSKCKIYTCRSLLWQVMALPYTSRRASTFYAIKFKNVIYMTNDKLSSDTGSLHRNSKRDTYHFKFMQHCFSDSPYMDPIIDANINENVQLYSIHKSRLGDIDLMYSAEMSGVDSKQKIKDLTNMDKVNNCRFVATKLITKPYELPWQTHPKVLKWWLQAYLINVSDIYVGQSSAEGYVESPPDHMTVNDLRQNQKWNPLVCLKFANTVLNKIKKQMVRANCPHTVYEFKYDPTRKGIFCKIHRGKTKLTFLSDDFVDFLRKET